MNQIFYNNNTERNLSQEVLRQINSAKNWIKACNLLFDDIDILTDLLNAIKRGVALFILTNLDGVTGEVYTQNSTGKKKHSRQSTQNILHSDALKQLYNAGAHISGLDGLHSKFLLTDNEIGLITSLNFTPNSVGRISELGVQVSGAEYRELEEIFDHIFLRPDQFRFADKTSHFSYERPSETIDPAQLSSTSRIKMTLAPTSRGRGDALSECDIHDLRDEIFDLITSAQSGEDLYIATYSLDPKAKNSNDLSLDTALIKAKKRGVNLHILMREEKKKVIKDLFIHYHKDNHAKVVMTPRKGILFTGNLTTESFENGFDLGVLLTPDQISVTKQFIETLIKQTQNQK